MVYERVVGDQLHMAQHSTAWRGMRQYRGHLRVSVMCVLFMLCACRELASACTPYVTTLVSEQQLWWHASLMCLLAHV